MVIDVRKEGEYTAEHIEDAYSKPLAYINDWVNVLTTTNILLTLRRWL